MRSRRVACVVWLLTLAASASASQGGAADPVSREWNQAGGNSAGTAVCGFAPLSAAPAEAWRAQFDQILSEPVTGGGTLYVVARKDGQTSLFALRVTDGQELKVPAMSKPERASVVAWQGYVAVSTASNLRIFAHRANSLKVLTTLKGPWCGELRACSDLLFAPRPDGLKCLDFAHGTELASLPTSLGRASIFASSATQLTVECVDLKLGEWQSAGRSTLLVLSTVELDGVGSGKLVVGQPLARLPGSFVSAPKPADLERACVAHVTDPADAEGAWLVSRLPKLSSAIGAPFEAGFFSNGAAPSFSLRIVGDVLVNGASMIGFVAEDGTLVRFASDGKAEVLRTKSEFPPGAATGFVTGAGRVAYLGNWAVDLAERRVLWSDPALPAARAIPAGDERIVYATESGTLLCIASSRALGAAAVAGPAKIALTRPGAGDGVVRSDGSRIAGDVTALAAGRWRVQDKSGKITDVESADAALVEAGGEVRRINGQLGVQRAWSAALSADHLAGLLDLFDRYSKTRFPDDCERLIDEARAFGLDDAGVKGLQAKLIGLAPHTASNADAQHKRLAADEQAQRAKSAKAYREAAAWCAAHGLALAATTLHYAAAKIDGTDSAPEIAKLVPAAFPWKSESDAPVRWTIWARALIGCDGEFIPREDVLWKRARRTPWNEATIGLRTPNLILFSRAQDPTAVAACLRNGELVVRELDRLFDPDHAQRLARDDSERLELRLHKSRDDYLSEATPSGYSAPPWSAGCYSNFEHLSRFYVPAKIDDPLGRGLDCVVSHELCHHYLDRLWLGAETARGDVRAGLAGYWVVEGFATFVEDQVVQFERRGRAFDDPTVASLDAMAQAAGEGHMIALENFIDMPQTRFAGLADDPLTTVRLRNTLVGLQLSERALFYEQSSSLVFFLMNRCGPEGRTRLLDYMRDAYRGRIAPSGWKRLGFDDVDELDDAFREFLAELRR